MVYKNNKLQQLFFKFPIKPVYLTEDFFISESNKEAFSYLNIWPNWRQELYPRILLLYGEVGSGKTHLSYIWQKISHAKRISIKDCYNLHFLINEQALILEDVNHMDEELLLHLINFSNENNQYLLLTSDLSPQNLKLHLPDLRSRMLAIYSIAIKQPDEELLKAVLLKHLTDRHLKITQEALNYIVTRIERSFNKLIQFIENLDKMSKIHKKSITIPLIRKTLMID